MKDADIHFRIKSVLKQKAQSRAKEEGESLSWIIVRALEQYLKGKTYEQKGK